MGAALMHADISIARFLDRDQLEFADGELREHMAGESLRVLRVLRVDLDVELTVISHGVFHGSHHFRS